MDLLISMLGDTNVQVTLKGLELLGALTHKAGWPIRSYADKMVSNAVDLLGDNKIVVRQAATMLINKMMHILSPAPILTIALPSLTHDNWRIREETINVVILALSSFPHNVLDIPRLVDALVPLLGISFNFRIASTLSRD